MVFAPAWIPFVHGGAHLGFWRPHTFVQSLALVPVGIVLLPLAIAIANPVGAAFRPIASSLLPVSSAPSSAQRPNLFVPRRALEAHTWAPARLTRPAYTADTLSRIAFRVRNRRAAIRGGW